MERSADPARAAVLDVTRALPRPLVAYVGRLSHEKGVDVLIDALTILRSRGFGGALAIAGSGPEQQRLTVQASRAGLASTLVFLGDVTAMDALYEVADVVVLPSRSEGLPNVLLEALFAGKAVVATRVGAVPDVLTLPAAGIVVPPEDAAALADAIALAVEHLGDPEGRTARKTIADAFSVARRAAAHLEVYRSIVSDVRSAAV
jgi:glycosyltransferase involved in cell wall biosynthesis